MLAALSSGALAAVAQTERQTGSRRVTTDPNKVAYRAMFAHVALTVMKENGPGFGSGVLVEPSAGLKELLAPNELLVASVSHNANDWTSQAKAYGTLFSPPTTSGTLQGWSRATPYNARLIGRYRSTDDQMAIDRKSTTTVDVAYFALQVPKEHLQSVKTRALPLADLELNQLKPGSTVVAVGSRGSELLSDGSHRSSLPASRAGVVLSSITEEEGKPIGTQYGPAARHAISTTIQCEPGDSGGALAWINPSNNRLEVLGVCYGGSKTFTDNLGWIDFRLDQAGVSQQLIDQLGMEQAALSVIPEARSPYRGMFSGWQALRALDRAIVSEYQALVKEHHELEQQYSKIREQLKGHNKEEQLVKTLSSLHNKATEPVLDKLRQLKPDYSAQN